MTLRARIMSIIAFLGILGSCYAADVENDIQDFIRPSNQLQLKDLLSTSDENNLAGPAAALMTLTGSSGTIHFLKAYLYHSNTTLCNGTLTLLGAVSVVDNGAGFPFTAGQTISLNQNAAYTLYTNSGQGLPNSTVVDTVTCMKLYLTGGNETNYHSSCMTFGQSCGGSICTTSTSTPSIPWVNTSEAPCVAPQLYITSQASTNNASANCIFGASGTITCPNTNTFTGLVNGIAINNGYAYLPVSSSPLIYACTVSATTGNLTCPAATSGFTSPQGITVSAGNYYFGSGALTIYYGSITQSTGILGTPASTFSSGNTPVSVTINRGYLYYIVQNNVNTANNIRFCKLNANGSLSPCSSTATSGPSVVNPFDIAIYNGYAYIVYSDAGQSVFNVMYCKVNNGNPNPADEGKLESCANTAIGPPGVITPHGIALYNGYAYLSNNSAPPAALISSCPINSLTGALGTCGTALAGSFSALLLSPKLMTVY